MTTPRKTAVEIKDIIIAQLETSLNTTIPLLPRSFNRVLAKALGGVFVLLYQFAGWILLQMFIKTASNEPVNINGQTITPLQLWGATAPGGPITQDPGVRAERTIQITVLVLGGTLTSGQRVMNPATGMIYVLVNDVVLLTFTVNAVIRATDAGALGNVDAGETLYLVSPPSSVEKDVVVQSSGSDVLGVDPETTEHFRQRIENAYAARTQGGAYADYRSWAEEVAGVKNAYPYSGWSFSNSFPSGGPGYVYVYIESESDPDGIPVGDTLLNAVEANINADISGQATRRNINALVEARPISRIVFDITVRGLYSTEDEAEVKDAIEEAIDEYLLDRYPFILGLHQPPRKDFVIEGEIAGVAGFAANALGASITGVTMEVSGTQYEGYPLQEGEKAKLGTITFV